MARSVDGKKDGFPYGRNSLKYLPRQTFRNDVRNGLPFYGKYVRNGLLGHSHNRCQQKQQKSPSSVIAEAQKGQLSYSIHAEEIEKAKKAKVSHFPRLLEPFPTSLHPTSNPTISAGSHWLWELP